MPSIYAETSGTERRISGDIRVMSSLDIRARSPNGSRETGDLIRKAVKRTRGWIEKFNPIAVVGLLSGGHDSMTANLIAHEAGADMSLHINTGIGVEQTRDYVRDNCS